MKLKTLQQTFAKIKVLIIDEYSMVGCNFLHMIDCRLRQASGQSTQVFGGISVVLAGDTKQLPPVLDTPLWNTPKTAMGLAGKAVYSLFEDVVELKLIVRQGGSDQQEFRDLLCRLRLGQSIKEDWELLKTRMPSFVTLEETSDMNESTILMPLRSLVESHNTQKLTELTLIGERLCRIDAVIDYISF